MELGRRGRQRGSNLADGGRGRGHGDVDGGGDATKTKGAIEEVGGWRWVALAPRELGAALSLNMNRHVTVQFTTSRGMETKQPQLA